MSKTDQERFEARKRELYHLFKNGEFARFIMRIEETGFNVKDLNLTQGDCLAQAVTYDDLRLLTLLLKGGYDSSSETATQYMPFHTAIRNNKLQAVRIFVQHGADLDKKSKMEPFLNARDLAEYEFRQASLFPVEKTCYDYFVNSTEFDMDRYVFWRKDNEETIDALCRNPQDWKTHSGLPYTAIEILAFEGQLDRILPSVLENKIDFDHFIDLAGPSVFKIMEAKDDLKKMMQARYWVKSGSNFTQFVKNMPENLQQKYAHDLANLKMQISVFNMKDVKSAPSFKRMPRR